MKRRGKWKTALAILLSSCVGLLCGCSTGGVNNPPEQPDQPTEIKRGLSDYDFTKASFATVDRLGRQITPMHKKKTDHERYVGVFYFLWLGTHASSAGVYDVTKLQQTEEGAAAVLDSSYTIGEKVPNTVNAEAGYPDGMESPTNYVHWTTEPLYGYYNTADEWVITRHMELLTMADVDFIFFDTTNDYDYAQNKHPNFVPDPSDPKNMQLSRPTYAVLDTILELSNQGWDVPKVVFYTNNKSGNMVQQIYDDFYASGKYDSIWFAPFGKPMIVGTTEENKGTDMTGGNRVDISPELQQYFDVRESQWPNQGSQPNGFPWMDWSDGDNFYFPENKMVNVNVAQHGASETSYSAYTNYGRPADGRSSRGWNEDEFTIDEDWEAGKNIEDQWETVFKYEDQGKTVEMVTASTWNEWLAWKYNPGGSQILYVDNFNAEFSRDMEMDRYYYQDNFYLQLARNVRKYKYGEVRDAGYIWQNETISGMSDFDKVTAVYKDFVGDARMRDFYGFDIREGSKEAGLLGSWYTDTSNRNDIVQTKVVHDNENIYFLVETKDDIKPYESGENWMNILIKTGASTSENSWEGYNYIINRNPQNGKASVDMSNGGWVWTNIGNADMQITGNKMMITVPLAMLGLSKDNFAFEFKVADNVTNYTDIMDYYVTGDSAPIGRFRYSYGYAAA